MNKSLKRISFVSLIICMTLVLFFLFHQNKIDRINQFWNTKLEGKVENLVSGELGPHGEHTQYMEISGSDWDYITDLSNTYSVPGNQHYKTISELKRILKEDLSEHFSVLNPTLSDCSHYMMLEKDNCKLFLWYAENMNRLHLLEYRA